jgi:hypothetical protein
MKYTKGFIAKIAIEFSSQAIPDNWIGIDAVLPLIERIREDGSIFIVKFDGERTRDSESGPFLVVIFGRYSNWNRRFIFGRRSNIRHRKIC